MKVLYILDLQILIVLVVILLHIGLNIKLGNLDLATVRVLFLQFCYCGTM